MTLPFASLCRAAIVAVPLLLAGVPARADMILYEPFDYGVSGALTGNGGNELGFSSASKWGVSGSPNATLASGLSLRSGAVALRTVGGAARATSPAYNGGSFYRKINTEWTGTVYGSYIVQPVANVGSKNVSYLTIDPAQAPGGAVGVNGAGILTAPDNMSYAGRLAASVKAAASADLAGNRIIGLGTNYLALFKVTNVGGSSGSSVIKMWLLSASQFAYFKTGGLTESGLDTAAIGAADANVWAKATATNTSSRPVLTTACYASIRVSGDGTHSPTDRVFDEIRLSNASTDAGLDEVTPRGSVIDTTGASNVTHTAATLCGALAFTNAPTQVYCYWGPQDCGPSPIGWAHTNYLGEKAVGSVSVPVTGLDFYGKDYYYTFNATNAVDSVWAATAHFRTSFGPLTDFRHRMNVTFSGYTPDEVLTNFPALVVLSTDLPGFDYSQFKLDNGADLRFKDSAETTELLYEVDTWNTNGTSYVWVQVPRYSSDLTIKALWGRTGVPPAAYTTDGTAWEPDYAAVWHMRDAGTTIRDATTNARNATAYGTTITTADGLIGQGRNFGGALNTDYVTTPYGNGLKPYYQPLTYTAWVKNNTLGAEQMVFSSGTDANKMYFGQRTKWAMGIQGSTWATDATPAAPNADTDRHMISLVFSDTSAQFYLDGIYRGKKTIDSNYTLNQNLLMGMFNGSYNWNGLIDEVRVSTVARSSNWLWACAMGVASNATFQTYGPIKSSGGNGTLVVLR